VLPDAKGYIKGYEYRPNGGMTPPIFLSPNSVIHVRLVDPANPWWGMAPLKAASMTADTDRAAIQWNYEAMKNRAVPDFLVSPDENMTLEQHEQFVTAMRRSLQGAMNARNPMVLSGKAAVHKLGFNSAEMDFLDTRRFNRESICAVFRTPVPLIIFDQQGGSLSNNVSPVYRFFWEQNMVPMVNKILESYNQILIPYYDKTKGKKLRIVADYEQIPAMATTLLDKAKTALVLSQIGIPFKHINKRLKMGFPLDMEMEQINVNRGTAIDRTHLDEDNTPSGTTNGSSGSLPQAATRGKKDGQR